MMGAVMGADMMEAGILTRLVSCVSIMKLCTCFSALVSSSFRATTATTSAVQPAPCVRRVGAHQHPASCGSQAKAGHAPSSRKPVLIPPLTLPFKPAVLARSSLTPDHICFIHPMSGEHVPQISSFYPNNSSLISIGQRGKLR